MAIDPSISLDTTPPQNPLAMVGQYANAAASLQYVQNQKAALPGIQADSAIKQRAANFNQWLNDNASNYIAPYPSGQVDANGNKITGPTGPNGQPIPHIDTAGLVNAAANAGYVTEAQSIAASDLKQQAQVLQNGLTNAQAKGATILNGQNAQNLAISARGYVSTLMDAYEKANPNVPPQMLDAEYNKLIKGTQDQFGSALNVYSVFGPPNEPVTNAQDNSVVTDPNTGKPQMQYKFDPAENTAMRTATMTPEVQQQLANQKEIIAQSGVTGNSSPSYRDPNSPETSAARAAAIASDPQHASVYSGMTASQLANNPTVGPMVLASILPASAKTTAVNNMIQQTNDAKNYLGAADALDKFKNDLSPGDLQNFTSAPIRFLQNAVSKYGSGQNSADYVRAETMLANINTTHPELNLTKLDAGALASALRTQGENSLKLSGTSGAVATSTTFGGAAQHVSAQGGAPAATASNPQGVQPGATPTTQQLKQMTPAQLSNVNVTPGATPTIQQLKQMTPAQLSNVATTNVVKLRDSSGKTYSVPADKAAALIKKYNLTQE